MNARWPADKVPGANQGLTEAEAAKLAQFLRRPHALSKRERDQMIRLQGKAAARKPPPSQCRASRCIAVPGIAMHCRATLGLAGRLPAPQRKAMPRRLRRPFRAAQ